MQLKTILNRVHKFQSFVYSDIKLTEHKQQIAMEITIVPRANNKPICSGCGKKRPGYDTRDTRRFEFIPFWGILVFFVYTMRRVNCPTCHIKIESVPWATGKYRITTTYAWYLAGLVFDWALKKGGLEAIGEINRKKAEKLYAAIDVSQMYSNPVDVDCRSWMNVPFILNDAELDADFLTEAAKKDLVTLKGHRSVGGMRASIYNAMPEAGVDALIAFMAEFEIKNS